MSIPASVRAMNRARPFIPGSDVTFPAPSPFPLRCAALTVVHSLSARLT